MDDPRLVASAVARLLAAGVRQRAALAYHLDAAMTDVLALDHVVTAPGTPPGELAEALLVSPSGATAVIDRLSHAGLIMRTQGAGRHRVALVATDAGRALHGQSLAPLRGDVEALIGHLARTERAVLEQFLTLLADLAEREAKELVAIARADARAASATPPPARWG